MIVSVAAAPPKVASPPPCPACNSTAMARISESRIRMPTRIPYMRGARYLGYGGAHKLRPATGIERRSADQHAIQFGLCEKLGGIFQVDAPTIKNHKRGDGGRAVLQPATNYVMHFGGVLWSRVASSTDCPNGFVRDRHATLAGVPGNCRFELAGHDRHRLARFALRERFTDTQHRVKVGRERGFDLLAGLVVGLAEYVSALRMADQRHARAGLSGKRTGDRAGERPLRLPVDVLSTDDDVPMAGDPLSDRLDRHRRRKEPHRPLMGDLASGKEGADVLAGFDGAHIHFPIAREDQGPHASSSAATPGSSLPSKNSSDAPPPVETWVS